MDLDNLTAFQTVDPSGMLGWIDALPQHAEDAWETTRTFVAPDAWRGLNHVVVAGMGGSAIGGDLVAALAAQAGRVPVTVVRGYDLPRWVDGRTLVVVSSYSGNTEESLALYDAAVARGALLAAVTSGGALAARAAARGVPVVRLPNADPAPQPRAMVGASFISLLGLLTRAELIDDLGADLAEGVAAMRARQVELRAPQVAVRNPAKRLAGQLLQRIPIVCGAGVLAPVARRWKTQLNENAKAWSGWDELPELDHNTIVGLLFPEALMNKIAIILLTSPLDPPAVQKRFTLTSELFMAQGLAVDTLLARGKSPLATMLTTLHFGDYVSYYLAMAEQTDPTPVPPIVWLKEALAER